MFIFINVDKSELASCTVHTKHYCLPHLYTICAQLCMPAPTTTTPAPTCSNQPSFPGDSQVMYGPSNSQVGATYGVLGELQGKQAMERLVQQLEPRRCVLSKRRLVLDLCFLQCAHLII